MDGKNGTHIEVFREAVPRLFGSLCSDYGFSLTQEEEWYFVAESEHSTLGIEFDRNQVSVRFRPYDEKDRRLPDSLKFLRGAGLIDIAIIAECLDPTANIMAFLLPEVLEGDPKRYISLSPEGVERVLERYVVLLQKYCIPFLKGEFSRWSQVEACLEERRKNLRIVGQER